MIGLTFFFFGICISERDLSGVVRRAEGGRGVGGLVVIVWDTLFGLYRMMTEESGEGNCELRDFAVGRDNAIVDFNWIRQIRTQHVM